MTDDGLRPKLTGWAPPHPAVVDDLTGYTIYVCRCGFRGIGATVFYHEQLNTGHTLRPMEPGDLVWCAWCDQAMAMGSETAPGSHGICAACARDWQDRDGDLAHFPRALA